MVQIYNLQTTMGFPRSILLVESGTINVWHNVKLGTLLWNSLT